jgi:hypothetical protein
MSGWSDDDALVALREARVTAADPTGTGEGGPGAAFSDEDANGGSNSGNDGNTNDTNNDDNSDDWRTLYRTIVGSLRDSSSSIFRSLSLETVILGFRALTAAHTSARDDLDGTRVAPAASRADAALVDSLLDSARWALAFDSSRRTAEDFARYLRVPVECVRYFAPDAGALEPAHAVVVDPMAPRVHVAVRGTTTWHDALTDLVAHTEELTSEEEEEQEEMEGEEERTPDDGGRPRPRERAHAGMLRAARALHRRHAPLLVELLSGEYAGYRVHCVGHSLGGGTAALLAHLLRRRTRSRSSRRGGAGGAPGPPLLPPEQEQQQQQPQQPQHDVASLASAVECTTYGCPPTVTPALARRMGRPLYSSGSSSSSSSRPSSCSSSNPISVTRSLVYNHDMVPRMSVASLAELRLELERHASAASDASPLARWVRETGALTATQRAAGQLLSLAAAAGAARALGGGFGVAGGSGGGGGGAAAAPLSRFMRAGFAAGAGALADKFKELHASAMSEQQPGEAARPQAGASAAAAAAATDAYGGVSGQGDADPAPVPLACPGELLYLRRDGQGADALFELRRVPLDGRRPGRILLKRSMLRDHMLAHMVRALRGVGSAVAKGEEEEVPGREAASAGAAASVSPSAAAAFDLLA